MPVSTSPLGGRSSRRGSAPLSSQVSCAAASGRPAERASALDSRDQNSACTASAPAQLYSSQLPHDCPARVDPQKSSVLLERVLEVTFLGAVMQIPAPADGQVFGLAGEPGLGRHPPRALHSCVSRACCFRPDRPRAASIPSTAGAAQALLVRACTTCGTPTQPLLRPSSPQPGAGASECPRLRFVSSTRSRTGASTTRARAIGGEAKDERRHRERSRVLIRCSRSRPASGSIDSSRRSCNQRTENRRCAGDMQLNPPLPSLPGHTLSPSQFRPTSLPGSESGFGGPGVTVTSSGWLSIHLALFGSNGYGSTGTLWQRSRVAIRDPCTDS